MVIRSIKLMGVDFLESRAEPATQVQIEWVETTQPELEIMGGVCYEK
ncbi:hypothetical protein [Microcoleus sp.]